jgi:hypothetical protein
MVNSELLFMALGPVLFLAACVLFFIIIPLINDWSKRQNKKNYNRWDELGLFGRNTRR